MKIFNLNRKFFTNFDWQLTAAFLLLCVSGLTLIYSAGFDSKLADSLPFRRQVFTMSIGFFIFVFCCLIDTQVWKRWSYFIYFIGCLLLLFILFGGVVAGGARRWLEIGGMRFQPSEFTKVALILCVAKLLSSEKAPKDGYTVFGLLLPATIILPVFVLIWLEPDLGTGLCHLLIAGSMLLVSGLKRGTLVKLFLFFLLLAVPAWNMLKDYQKKRVLSFLSPESDPLGSGYHALQSKIAVGSGSVTGKGFLQGTQTQLSFLPEQTTDFIFSVLAEEWGFIGSLAILCLYGFLLYRIVKVGLRSVDPFATFVCVGVAAMIFWHVVVNIGMVIGVLPVVGLTLPLLSFGGSSVIAVMGALGLVVGISSRRFMFS